MKKVVPLKDTKELIIKLSEDIVTNSGFIFRAGDMDFNFFADEELSAVVGVQKDSDHCIFWGDWNEVEIPFQILPTDGIFVSAASQDIIEILKQHFKLDGEWPCWTYLAPENYGSGEWDKLGSLNDEDISFIAGFWELGGDDNEEHIRDRVNRFESICIRENGQPVSWCGMHFEVQNIGNLGFAHTLDDYRRKGYAGLVTKALVNRLSKRGMRATSHVIKDNSTSISLSASLGFEIVGEATWAMFK